MYYIKLSLTFCLGCDMISDTFPVIKEKISQGIISVQSVVVKKSSQYRSIRHTTK